MAPFMTQASPRSGLALIALFTLVKGVVLLLVGAGLLRLVDPEIATFLAPAVDLLHLHGHSPCSIRCCSRSVCFPPIPCF